MPMQKTLYPPNWPAIAEEAKRQVNYRCQQCGKRQGEWTRNRFGLPCKVILTCAHLDHDPGNKQARLAVWCAQCHCRYDAGHEQRGRKRANMNRARGQMDLF